MKAHGIGVEAGIDEDRGTFSNAGVWPDFGCDYSALVPSCTTSTLLQYAACHLHIYSRLVTVCCRCASLQDRFSPSLHCGDDAPQYALQNIEIADSAGRDITARNLVDFGGFFVLSTYYIQK